MKTILLFDPRFPDRKPLRLTVDDAIASAAVRSGVAAAANANEAGTLAAGGPLDAGMLTEVVLQHGANNGGLTRVVMPYSVILVAASLGRAASIGAPLSGVVVSPTPTIAFAKPFVSVSEGDTDTKTVTNTINVTRNGVTGALTINLTYGGTATSGTDYVAGGTQLIIGASQDSGSFDLTINGDTTVEPDETIIINAALAGYSATASKTLTIGNDDLNAGATIGGTAIGTLGAAGTPFSDLRFDFGDDFVSAPNRWNGRNIGRGYSTCAIQNAFRKGESNDATLLVDPGYRGYRNALPADTGVDRLAISNSVLKIAPSAPDAIAGLYDVLHPTFTGGSGDANNKPRLFSSQLCTAPDFMLSGQADFAVAFRVRMPSAILRGWFPATWVSTILWPDNGEIDGPEWVKSSTGAITARNTVFASATDGGAAQNERYTRSHPANVWITVGFRKRGTTIEYFDDAASPGTLAVVATATGPLVQRVRGALDIRLQMRVLNDADQSTFTASDWVNGNGIEYDWFQAWVPAAAASGVNPMTILPAINTTPGGSWATTLPSLATVSGGRPGRELINGVAVDIDSPGYQASPSNRLLKGAVVDQTARTVTGTVPTTEGGFCGLLITYGFDDGSPARRFLQPYYVAPAIQNLPASFNGTAGTAFDRTIAYTDFHSGDQGPHTYNVQAPAWVTVTGNGTGNVRLTGTYPATPVAGSLFITCTNNRQQATPVIVPMSSVAASSSAFRNRTDWEGFFDMSDPTATPVSSGQVTALTNKVNGGGNFAPTGAPAWTIVENARNSRQSVRLTRNVSDKATVPRMLASAGSIVSQRFQGSDKPYCLVAVFTPLDANTCFIAAASTQVGNTGEQVVGLVRRATTASSVRKNISGNNLDVTFGAGQAANIPRIVVIRHNGTTVDVWDTSTTKLISAAPQDAATFTADNALRLGAAATTDTVSGSFALVQGSTDYDFIGVLPTMSDADIVQMITDLAKPSEFNVPLS